MNNIQKLARLGQSIWYDSISRGMILNGELRKMVDEGLSGVTSNPAIFERAISGSSDYEGQIRELIAGNPSIGAAEIIRTLMVQDIQMACDELRPAYERSNGIDGFASIEVRPGSAHDTASTIAEVRDLFARVGRPNLMVKIPSTTEGLPAIEEMIYEGRNINVTLIFSVERYRQVAGAYIRGLERRVKEGKPVEAVRSVASVFVSRVDTLVDSLLAGKDPVRFNSLKGKAAVANAKLVYQAFKEIFGSPGFRALEAKGAQVQRPLWGSTGTKNPAYSDLLYVDRLIGPRTVNTVPPQTYTAILDHGSPLVTIEDDLDGARASLSALAATGIDLNRVMQRLEDEGIAAFEKSFDGLTGNVLGRRDAYAAIEAQNT